ncbi:MAG: hypothetical protein Q9215_006002 [Flavoplaca cf. flavocitrina]
MPPSYPSRHPAPHATQEQPQALPQPLTIYAVLSNHNPHNGILRLYSSPERAVTYSLQRLSELINASDHFISDGPAVARMKGDGTVEVSWKGVAGGFTVVECELWRLKSVERITDGGRKPNGAKDGENSGGRNEGGSRGRKNASGGSAGNGGIRLNGGHEGGSKGGRGAGEDKPDEELYIVYELGTYRIFGVWDDAKVAYEEGERVGGLMMPVRFYH